MKIINYIRYIIATGLFLLLFYGFAITIPKDIILDKIEEKLPLKIERSGMVLTINNISINRIYNNEVESTINVNIKSNNSLISFLKYNQDLRVESKTTPIIESGKLRFKVLDLDVNSPIKSNLIKKVISNNIEKLEFRIKKLEHIKYIITINNIKFLKNESLNIDVSINKFIIIFLIILLLLREIGLFLIILYQNFISPRKGYNCARGQLHNEGTCSSITKKAFEEKGFIHGIKEYRNTTKECKKAYKEIRSNKCTNMDSTFCLACDTPFIGCGDAMASGCEMGSCDIGAC